MNQVDTSKVVLYAPFAGQERRFKLPLGKIADLERLCGAGIGAIMVRLVTHQFKAADIWEPIRLGLEGGGMSEPEATAMCMSYHEEPLMWRVELASQILQAAVNGIPDDVSKKKMDETTTENPGISPSSTQPQAH